MAFENWVGGEYPPFKPSSTYGGFENWVAGEMPVGALVQQSIDPPTGTPTGLTATTVSSSQINLAWTDNADDEDNYIIERSLDGESWSQIASIAADSTSYSDTGLDDWTTYHYRVAASNAGGLSDYSNVAIDHTFLAAPTDLTADAAGATSINLSWTDNSGNEDSYRIERSPDGSSGWTVIASVDPDSTSYVDTALVPQTQYCYRVQARVFAGYSDYSNVDCATTTALAPPSGTGDPLRAAAGDQIIVQLQTPSGEDWEWGSGVDVFVQWYGAQAQGGFDRAELFANASGSEELWDLLRNLGYHIILRNRDHAPVWAGMIDEITLDLGNIQVGLTLNNMYNRIAVAYSTTGGDGVSTRSTTAWAEDTESVNRYGYKELLYTMTDVSTEQAEAQRDTLLAALSKPSPIIRVMRSGQPGAYIRCIGLYHTLDWRYYANDAGLEESGTIGGDDQPLGQGYTASTIGFTQDGRIHDKTDDKLTNLVSGFNVEVSGSSSNNGTALLNGSGRAGESYTATTLEMDPTDDINDSSAGMAFIDQWDIINVSGTTSNDGDRWVTSAGASHITVSIPPNVTAEAEGPSITIDQADSVSTTSTFTNELPGSAVTLAVHGVKLDQSFTLTENTEWTLNKVSLRIRKVGSPADNVKVELCADSSGAPGTVLDSATVAASAIGTAMAWITFDMANTETLTFGTTYHLVVSRTGSNDIDDFYVVDVDEDLSYSGGVMKVWNGSSWVARATDADLVFRLTGASETTGQIQNIFDACGQHFNGIDVVDASSVFAAQYRVGDTTGKDEMSALLSSGDGTLRLLASVTPERILRIKLQETTSEDDVLISADGSLRTTLGQPFTQGRLPVGQWLRLSNVPGNVDALAQLRSIYIERAEFHAKDDNLRLEAQGDASPWEIGKSKPSELSRQANELKPYIVAWD